MSEASDKLLKSLDNLSAKLGDKNSKSFPLWGSLIAMINNLQEFVHLEYYFEPTEAQKSAAREFENKINKFKKHLKANPSLSEEEQTKLLYGKN